MKFKTHSISINGERWRYRILDHETFVKLHFDGAAITDTDINRIDFNGQPTKATVMHELFHARVSQTSTESANLSAEQMEELCCSILERDYENLGKWTQRVLEKLKEKPNE